MFCRVRPLLNMEQATPTEGGMKLEYPDQGSDDRKLVLSYPPSEVCVQISWCTVLDKICCVMAYE